MAWLIDPANILMAVGLLLAVIDITIFGFATFYLTLLGIGAVTAGLMIRFGLIGNDLTTIFASLAVATAFYTALLWKPLKRLQRTPSEPAGQAQTDLVGLQFVLETDVAPNEPGTYHYSGVDWKVISQDPLVEGTRVEVIAINVGEFEVKAA